MKQPQQKKINFDKHSFTAKYAGKGQTFDLTNELDLSVYNERRYFNYALFDFDVYFNQFRNSHIPAKKRLESADNLMVSKKSKKKDRAFEFIKKIANSDHSELNIFQTAEAERYLSSYYDIYAELQEQFDWQASDYFIVPLKGGGIITRLFSLDRKKVIDIECKRLPLNDYDGHFALGMNINSEYNDLYFTVDQVEKIMTNFDGKKITILEVCVATGMTTFGFLFDLYAKGQKNITIQIICAAVSQQGYEATMEFAKQLGFSVSFITGKVIYDLADHFAINTDSLVYEDGSLVVKSPWDAYKSLYKNSKPLL